MQSAGQRFSRAPSANTAALAPSSLLRVKLRAKHIFEKCGARTTHCAVNRSWGVDWVRKPLSALYDPRVSPAPVSARLFAHVQIVGPTAFASDLVFPGQSTALGPGYGKTIGT